MLAVMRAPFGQDLTALVTAFGREMAFTVPIRTWINYVMDIYGTLVCRRKPFSPGMWRPLSMVGCIGVP